MAAAARLPDSGDVMKKFLRANHIKRARQKLPAQRALLEADPGSVGVRTALLVLLVVDLDAPAEASEVLADDVAAPWSQCVALAAKDPAGLDAPACKRLGEWYDRELRGRAGSPVARANLLTRAQTYYKRFLAAPGAAAPETAAVRVALARVEAELKRLSDLARAPAPGTSGVRTAAATARPKDARTYAGHYYKVIRERATWREAKAACKKLGGHLACIETAKEMAYIKRLVGSRRMWVGATDERVEGRWVWLTGRPVGKGPDFWEPREPSATSEENFATVTRSGLKDGPSPHSAVSGYVCEWDR